jgi:hypothetical protein
MHRSVTQMVGGNLSLVIRLSDFITSISQVRLQKSPFCADVCDNNQIVV